MMDKPGEAFEFVGSDDFCFFKCYTGQLTNKLTGDVGRFETEYRYSKTLFDAMTNQKDWLMASAKEVVTHAAVSTRSDLRSWTIEFSPMLAYLNIPSHLFMPRQSDRQWLGL